MICKRKSKENTNECFMILLEGMWNVLWMVWMEMWESFFRVLIYDL
jgi:hypothetical protein